MAYPANIIQEVIKLRNQGKTYGEIRLLLKRDIPKSTLSEWCKNATLPKNYSDRVAALNINNLNKARLIAQEISKIKREEFLKEINNINLPIATRIHSREIAKIALAMLCLGEASRTRGTFNLGSSDPRIITLFIELLKKCFTFDLEKVRCTVQCRADQDTERLEKYWRKVDYFSTRVQLEDKG